MIFYYCVIQDLVIWLLLGFLKMGSNLTWRYVQSHCHVLITSLIVCHSDLTCLTFKSIVLIYMSLSSQLEKAKELVRAAIHAGIMDDLGSGNNIDICVITKEGVDYIRPYQESEFRDNR